MADHPTFQYTGEGFRSLRAEIYAGNGLQADCRSCGHVAVRTARELLERHWRHVEAPLREIMARSSCPNCGSKALVLNFVSGVTPFPLDPDYKAWEAAAAMERRRERFEAWLEDRRKAERTGEMNQVAADYRLAKGR